MLMRLLTILMIFMIVMIVMIIIRVFGFLIVIRVFSFSFYLLLRGRFLCFHFGIFVQASSTSRPSV